ncbi:hypothetical protein [Sphingomicrobium aestuariivivum]|uniref:hypothetical protein n=1 Tax=Sphingomicrobium aestuariivivum TaxID=1582356 RepID=UPI001FD66818|nr:hypothetical protein [Sphingomicrobium aestuariivivum]MCJ8190032.1 hypothetical protein [Sphingomicrobium aestuariivivum]
MTSFQDKTRPWKFFAPMVSSCAALLLSLPGAANATVGDDRVEAVQQMPAEKTDPYAQFLRKYVDWASIIEAEGQRRGTPLTSGQIELARQIGIQRPEEVRIIMVDAVPFPSENEDMRTMGEALGFIGPDVINNAQAFGYTIWVRDGYTLDRPNLAHELVHVMQIEREGDFSVFVRQYMMQLLEHGHMKMPLEIEAYEANEKFGCETPS